MGGHTYGAVCESIEEAMATLKRENERWTKEYGLFFDGAEFKSNEKEEIELSARWVK